MTIDCVYTTNKPFYKNLSIMLQKEYPSLFADDTFEYNKPFLRTLDLIYSVKPFVGTDNKLHLDFENTDKTLWCIDMKKSVLAWNKSKHCHGNDEEIYNINGKINGNFNAINLFESEQIIPGTLDAMWGIMYWCSAGFLSEFLTLPYLDTLNLMQENAFIYENEIGDDQKIDQKKDFLCKLFNESLEKWPARDTDLTETARKSFQENNVSTGIMSMMECVHSKLPSKCSWQYCDF